MRFLLILISMVLFFCVGCFSDNELKFSYGTCSFTVSGDVTATYNGDMMFVTGGSIKNMICDTSIDGTLSGYPQLSIGVEYTDTGTYPLSAFPGDSLTYSHSDSESYKSTDSSTDCSIIYTTANSGTFACTDLTEDGGTGSVTVTSGSFSF